MIESAVLLHGVWMPGGEMLLLKRHLESEAGIRAHVFSYPSVRGSLDQHVAALTAFAAGLDAERLHFVGHSLGGIVALKALGSSELPAGRVVCLGSPLCGSLAASALMRYRWGKFIAGDALPEAVLAEPASTWAQPVVRAREIGVIAGDRSAGMGRLLASFDQPNDGTVAVSETALAGAKDHIVMHVSHSGMVLSRDVAIQTAAFLQRGEFLRP